MSKTSILLNEQIKKIEEKIFDLQLDLDIENNKKERQELQRKIQILEGKKNKIIEEAQKKERLLLDEKKPLLDEKKRLLLNEKKRLQKEQEEFEKRYPGGKTEKVKKKNTDWEKVVINIVAFVCLGLSGFMNPYNYIGGFLAWMFTPGRTKTSFVVGMAVMNLFIHVVVLSN